MDTFQSYRQRLFDLVKRDAYQKKEVTLASGKKSDFYVDCRQVVLTAEGHFLVGWLVHHILRSQYPSVRAVGGLTMGADPLASATSLISFLSGANPLNAFYVRKEAKGHGTGQWIEGLTAIPAQSDVAILEDVVTTGDSALKAIERAQLAGLKPRCVIALVDRQEGGRENIEKHLPLVSLIQRQELAS